MAGVQRLLIVACFGLWIQGGMSYRNPMIDNINVFDVGLDDFAGRPGLLPVFRALTSHTVPMSTVRAMMTRYVTDLDLGDGLALATLRMANYRQDHLAHMLLFLHVLEDTLTKAIRDVQLQEKDDRVYTFLAEPVPNYIFHYIDEDGSFQGYFADLIGGVCKEAGKKCRLENELFRKCLTSDRSGALEGGKGILGGTGDACFLTRTDELDNIFAFTESFYKYSGNSRFYVKTENPKHFDPKDITRKKIVYLKGFQSNFRCLAKNNVTGSGIHLHDYILLEYSALPKYLEKHQDVDAVFGLELPVWGEDGERRFELLSGVPEGYVPIGDTLSCSEGVSVASRKDNPITEWFNEALSKMKKSGKYAALCMAARRKYENVAPLDCDI